MVGIFNKALIFLVKSLHDGVVALGHLVLDVLRTLAYRLDWLVDGELDRMPEHPVDVLHAWLDIETAVDGKRTNRQLQLVGKHEGSTAEHAHVAGEGAGTLREYNERHAFLEHLARLVVRGTDLGRTALVYEDVVGIDASLSHERDVTDAFLHHPLEITAQEAIDEEDVEGALVIRHEHVALAFLQVLPTLYLDGEEEDSDPQL